MIVERRCFLSAREKLNGAYLIGIGAFSGFVGLTTGSITVCLICFALLIAVFIYDGAIRPNLPRQ